MKTSIPRPAIGKILVSEPFMMDSYFQRSVVLLAEYSITEGTIGFILNKQTTVQVCDVLQGFPKSDIPLYFGGPVQTDTIHFLHSINELEGSREIQKGIYWGGNLDQLKYMIIKERVQNQDVRFFAGYSGWDPEQLNQELKHHTWLLYQCTKKLAFLEDPMKLWGKVLRDMGSEFAIMANFPVDPSLN